MNDTDKVTLEWLMRFDGVVEQATYYETCKEISSSGPYVANQVAIWAACGHDGGKVQVNLMAEPSAQVKLWNPTIARFHEAVAFLGAKLPPLRPGEA